MTTILDTIVESTRELLARRRVRTPPGDLERMPGFDRAPLPFAAALRGKDLAVISECKKASPSKGVIRPDYDAAAVAGEYESAGAEAISVLTEPDFFLGCLEDLAAVRASVRLPLLRKDFVIDEYQLLEARAYGADAVLLIATILDRPRLAELHDAATELGLACLVECYDAHELDRLDFGQVTIVGVNNRNLRTFEVDRGHAARVLALVPDDVIRVAESGLRTAADFAAMRRAGLDAVLVGEAFMRAASPGAALTALRGQTRRLMESITGDIRR